MLRKAALVSVEIKPSLQKLRGARKRLYYFFPAMKDIKWKEGKPAWRQIHTQVHHLWKNCYAGSLSSFHQGEGNTHLIRNFPFHQVTLVKISYLAIYEICLVKICERCLSFKMALRKCHSCMHIWHLFSLLLSPLLLKTDTNPSSTSMPQMDKYIFVVFMLNNRTFPAVVKQESPCSAYF